MGFTIGDALPVAMPVIILVAVLWALAAALKPRNPGLSDAERYQRELAARSAAHQASQVQAATAARARTETSTRPGQAAYNGPILPNGQLNPQLALQLQGMVRSGQKIQAIKLLRKSTHSDLLTAKNYIDRL
jgi:ribosomal protein L7/L12